MQADSRYIKRAAWLFIALISFIFQVSPGAYNLNAQSPDEAILFSKTGYNFPYHVNQPLQLWKLPKNLVEISGLGYIDEDRLACVQDEKGNIYIFNLNTGEIESKIDFGDDGDYEGLEIVDDDAWILKSKGDLYRVKHFRDDDRRKLKKYEIPLSRKNEPEGIAYDPFTHALLLPCKGHPFIDSKEGRNTKAVYLFDLATKTLKEEPEFLIDLDTLKTIKNFNTMSLLGLALLSSIDYSRGDVTFQPSGIAVHPLTGDIYIIGAVGNMLLVLDREGAIRAVVELRSSLFLQPEGICFSPSGDLFIANEGKDQKATILQFRMN